MRIAAYLCLVTLALWAAACGGTPSATQPVAGEGNATLTTGPATSPASTPAASVMPQPTAPPTATLPPITPSPASTDTFAPTPTQMTTATPTAPTTEPAAVLWRVGGAKDVEDAPFTDLGGLDVAGERVYVADRFGGVRIYDLDGDYQGLVGRRDRLHHRRRSRARMARSTSPTVPCIRSRCSMPTWICWVASALRVPARRNSVPTARQRWP